MFHHSSFLAGGATLAAGRLVAEHGILKVLVHNDLGFGIVPGMLLDALFVGCV